MKTSAPVLAIDCSTRAGSAAVGIEGRTLAEVYSSLRSRHSETLLPSIDQAMAMAEVERSELGAVVVAAGPGSFTGLRIAAATAKGISHALDIPLRAFSSLLTVAVPYLRTGLAVGSLFDARGRDVFFAAYRELPEGISVLVEPAAVDLDRAVKACREHRVGVLVGDAVERHGRELAERTSAMIIPSDFGFPRASSLLNLDAAYPAFAAIGNVPEWEPDYLRASGAERIRERTRGETSA